MKKYILLNILLSLSILSFAQVATFKLSGQVTCQSDDFGMAGVQVVLTQNGQLIDSISTDQDGNYEFLNIPKLSNLANYTVDLFYLGQPLNGVSTFDMVVTTRHILGVDTMDPAKTLAADLNRSGTLTTFDLVQMRAWILFLPNTSTFPSLDWLFYREVNGQIEQGPFTFIAGSNDRVLNIKAIKRGDVNGSAICRE